ncbi:VOC family protein [Staphylococcus lloydii]|uniref:VOC family protein n=1 Tax=Staphylococcus lloydii TaxID=2781774 RepID=UPI002929E2B3|nr:VOC family protein [Staphylococcus lloydii]MDU9418203.1 VOC family protein [Staphylococcus lloydii]
MNLKLDHFVHYINNLSEFKYPGELFTLYNGGRHERFGTFNRLAYISNAYIELLDVYNKETLLKLSKTDEGRVAFPSKLVQDNYKQGLKTLAFSTDDIDYLKLELESKGIDIIGPVKMNRVDAKGKKTEWQLLYINELDEKVKPPFFIQWDEPDEVREKKLAPYRQNEFTVKRVRIGCENRKITAAKWRQWFEMLVVNDDEHVTQLQLPNDNVIYEFYNSDNPRYEKIVLHDSKTTASYTLIIRGLHYRCEAD